MWKATVLLLSLSALPCPAATAKPTDATYTSRGAKAAQARCQASAAKAYEQWKQSAEAARRQYVKELAPARQAAVRKGDLAEAEAIQAAIDEAQRAIADHSGAGRTVTVRADKGWQRVQRVRKGQVLMITARGQWAMGPGWPMVGPENSLVGRVGDQSFAVGARFKLVVERDGELQVSAKDGNAADNTGAMTVTVFVTSDPNPPMPQPPSDAAAATGFSGAQAKLARQKLDVALTKSYEAWRAAALKTRSQYVKDLEAAKQSAMKDGDLEEVNRIAAAAAATAELIDELAGKVSTHRCDVRADQGWQRVILVTKGVTYAVAAEGVWSMNKAVPAASCGPDGFGTDRNAGKLMGRVGGGQPFVVGSSYRLSPNADGALEMRAQDGGDVTDNDGAVTVTIKWTVPAAGRPGETAPVGGRAGGE